CSRLIAESGEAIMSAHRSPLAVLGIFVALLASRPTGAFRLDEVVISPQQPDPSTPVSMAVSFTTPTSPAFLFSPTLVVVDGASIIVDLFVDSGVFQATASGAEEIALGMLPAGSYEFHVTLH